MDRTSTTHSAPLARTVALILGMVAPVIGGSQLFVDDFESEEMAMPRWKVDADADLEGEVDVLGGDLEADRDTTGGRRSRSSRPVRP